MKSLIMSMNEKKRLVIVHNYKNKFFLKDIKNAIEKDNFAKELGVDKIEDGYFANPIQERSLIKQDHFIIGSF